MERSNYNSILGLPLLAMIAAGVPARGAEPQAVMPTPAEAQPTSAPQASNAGDPGEIIVTANKREQRLNDVGITIAAITSSQLAQRHIESLSDIAQAVPGLSYSKSASNTPIFTLRGIGFYDTSLAAYPTTSIYVDEVPLPFPVMASQAGFDLERIEVLKGPQGLLFGNNATGGAINYIAAKPTNHFEAGGDVTYSRFNTFLGNAYVSGPITDTLRGRIAVRGSTGDGWQQSYTRNDTNGATNYFTGRGLLDWTPTDRLHFLLNVNGWIDRSDPQAAQFEAAAPEHTETAAAIEAYPVAPANDRAADWGPAHPKANDTFYQVSLRGSYQLTDNVSLVSITALSHYKLFEIQDGDGTALQTLDLDPRSGHITSFSQELRLTNGSHGRFRWVFGGNYSRDDTDDINNLGFLDGTSGKLLGIEGLRYESVQNMRNYAVFGNGEYDVGSHLTLRGGVRYTEADRDGTFCSSDPNTGTTNVFFTNLSSELTGTTVAPIQPSQCFALEASGLPSLTPTAQKLDEHNVSWRVGADWKLRHGLLLYGNVSKGYKAGSFPALSASSVTQYSAVKQESVMAYEGGIKADLFNRLLSITAAGYYYDYSNKQLKSKVNDPVFGPLDVLVNVPKSSVRGAEAEVNLRPVRGLVLAGSAVFTDARIDDFTGISGDGVADNYAGATVPFAPKWQLTGSADYTRPIANGMTASIGASLTHQSWAATVIGGTGLYTIAPYTLLDLRAGFGPRDERWRLSVFGKNVTNKYYWTNSYRANDEIDRLAGMPATYGVTLAVKFAQ